jgi:hypothetical protein
METEPITIRVNVKTAQIFKSASREEQQKLEALLNLHLTEALKTTDSLRQIMSEISQKAQERGLTADMLRSILDE